MSYFINYNPETANKFPVKTKSVRKSGYAKVIAIILIMVCIILIYSARESIVDWLLPGDSVVTKAAISGFVDDIKNGAPFSEAITAFCREIVQNGNALE